MTFLLLWGTILWANTKAQFVGNFYVKHPFVHLHFRPDRYSRIMGTLTCGEKIKAYNYKEGVPNLPGRIFVKWRSKEGYLQAKALIPTVPKCLKKNYPYFYELYPLSPTDRYYWGRLYDQYLEGKTGVY